MNSASPLQFQINRKTIVTNIATLFSGSAIAQLVNAITFILIARQLGPENYGQYTGSMVFATFCSIVFNLGLNLWLLHEGGRSPSLIGKLTGSIISLQLLVGAIWLVIMYVIAGAIDSSSLPAEYVRLASLTIWFSTMFTSILTSFRAILRNLINSLLDVAATLAVFIFTIILILQGINEVAIFMQTRAIVYIVSFAVALLTAWSLLELQASRKVARRAVLEAPPYAMSEFLAWTYMRVDVLIIAFMLDEYQVGLFAPAEGIVNALYIIPLSIHLVMVPVLSNLFPKDVSQAWITAKRTVILLAIVGMGIFLALLFGGKFLILLLGTAYTGSLEILQILSVILFIHSITFGVAAILVATNQQGKRSIVQTIAVVINVGLNFAVITRWGIVGVAWVYVFTEIFLLLGYTWLVARYKASTNTTIKPMNSGST